MAPILPGLSDDPAAMADVVRAARDAGATSIWTNVLHLDRAPASTSSTTSRGTGRSCSRKYEALYAGRAYVANDVIDPRAAARGELAARYEIADRRVRRSCRPSRRARVNSCR